MLQKMSLEYFIGTGKQKSVLQKTEILIRGTRHNTLRVLSQWEMWDKREKK